MIRCEVCGEEFNSQKEYDQHFLDFKGESMTDLAKARVIAVILKEYFNNLSTTKVLEIAERLIEALKKEDNAPTS